MSDKKLKASNAGILKGSYSQASYLSLRDMGNKNVNSTFGGANSSKLPTPQLSRVSLSQLRLDSSAKLKKWEELDDFNLEELRDGFFDPVFTKPERLVLHDERDNEDLIHSADVYRNCKATFRNFIPIEKVWKDFRSNIVAILKYFIAYFIGLIICVIHPSGKWIGHEYRYFLLIAVLIHHPVRNVGVQLEMTVASIIGGSLGLGWSALAWYISVATKPTASHQGGILFASLVLALFVSIWLKEIYQRFLYLSLSFSIAIIFLHNVSLVFSKDALQWQIFWDFGISYLFGILLSLVICLFVSPHSGNAELMKHYGTAILDIKQLLVTMIDKDKILDEENLHSMQRAMVKSLNVGLSEGYREFANQWTISKFNEVHLKELRNALTRLVSPLRVLPLSHKLLNQEELQRLYDSLGNQNSCQNVHDSEGKNIGGNETPMDISGSATPLPRTAGSLLTGDSLSNEMYLSVLRSTFSKDIFGLISEMIYVIENMSTILKKYEKPTAGKEDPANSRDILKHSSSRLKRKIYKLDVCYKEFTKSNFFCQELLADADSVDIFLFLRYIRNAAKHLIQVNDFCRELGTDIHWRITPPHYPLERALIRLPRQCALDEGAGNVLHYFETKRDVDDIFERLYNSYTSRHKYTRDTAKNPNVSIRAIDHNDFNFHSTQNPWRFRIWKFSSLLVGVEMKWTMKILFVIVFFCLPGWLPDSYHWYQQYQCWWAPMTFFLLAHRKYSGKWDTMVRRLGSALVGIFWGWAANQSRHFGSPYVICTFGGLLALPFAMNFLVYRNTKSSFAALLCFSVIALEPYSKGHSSLNTAGIWKNTWVTGLAFVIAILTSVPINWIVWSFKARSELRLSVSSLLAHISQSYQSVTDRYLYRDSNDAPTELTLALSHIREVRLTQSILAVRDLLTRAEEEPSFISNFSPSKYGRLLDACDFLLEKTIEARISGSFFEVWDQDSNNETTRALLSLRRDSVSSVIFVFYILSNCYRSKNKIPRYLPNPVLSRKKLYDFISQFEHQKRLNAQDFTSVASTPGKNTSLEKKMFKDSAPTQNDDNYEKSHWTEIHGMAFARAFTDITEAIHLVVTSSKEILGEERY